MPKLLVSLIDKLPYLEVLIFRVKPSSCGITNSMKCHFALVFLTIAFTSYAQPKTDPVLKGLVDAEWKFINTAKEKNTRDAFIESLADDAVTFGKEIQKGKDYLISQQPNESWLYWEPVYSVIAASGDFGFNTGPWEFRSKRTDEKAIAYGQFVTVWKKVNGEWKAAIDIGISHDAPETKEAWKTSLLRSKAAKQADSDFAENIEGAFQVQLAKDPAAYKQFLSSEARVYRQRLRPFVSQQQVEQYFNSTSEKISFTSVDGAIATSGDLAFVYGKAAVQGAEARNAFFMRIWRLENGKWKIVLDLVN